MSKCKVKEQYQIEQRYNHTKTEKAGVPDPGENFPERNDENCLGQENKE